MEIFLGEKKQHYEYIISIILKNYHKMRVKLSLKNHFLHPHQNFPLKTYNEPEEYFNQGIQFYGGKYQGFWNKDMLSDYCWYTSREIDINR